MSGASDIRALERTVVEHGGVFVRYTKGHHRLYRLGRTELTFHDTYGTYAARQAGVDVRKAVKAHRESGVGCKACGTAGNNGAAGEGPQVFEVPVVAEPTVEQAEEVATPEPRDEEGMVAEETRMESAAQAEGGEGMAKFKCDDCGETFSSGQGLGAHRRYNHGGAGLRRAAVKGAAAERGTRPRMVRDVPGATIADVGVAAALAALAKEIARLDADHQLARGRLKEAEQVASLLEGLKKTLGVRR
jgi:hypothetical protein